jgi:hypothetical protein
LLLLRDFIFIMFLNWCNGSIVCCFYFLISLVIMLSDTFRLIIRIWWLDSRRRFLMSWWIFPVGSFLLLI